MSLLASALLLGNAAALADDKIKLVVPEKSAIPPKANGQNKKPKPIDINRASAAQLKTVPGIGDAEAERIIKARPYRTKAHLVTEKVLTFKTYVAVRARFVAIPEGRPTPNK